MFPLGVGHATALSPDKRRRPQRSPWLAPAERNGVVEFYGTTRTSVERS